MPVHVVVLLLLSILDNAEESTSSLGNVKPWQFNLPNRVGETNRETCLEGPPLLCVNQPQLASPPRNSLPQPSTALRFRLFDLTLGKSGVEIGRFI